MSKLLEGRVAAVTGAGRGIGRAHSLLLARYGAKVVVNDLGVAADGTGGSASPAQEVVDEIKKAGGQAVANYASVATSEGADSIVKTAVDTFSRLDILVNNAGVLRDKMIFNMTDEEWDLVIKTHLYGTFYCTRAACRVMKDQKYGRIINTSSIAGMGQLGQTNYAAAKEGIVGLTRTVAKEMARSNGTCNAIRPVAATRMTLSDELFEARKKTMGAAGAEEWKKNFMAATPEDISPVIVYLASEQAGGVSGRIFDVRHDFIALYDDPPRFEKTIVKAEGRWSPEELLDVMPKTLCADLEPQPPTAHKRLASNAKGWELVGGKLKESQPIVK